MLKEEKEQIIKLMNKVSKDVEDDVIKFDQNPFNGAIVGEFLGYQAAAITTICKTIIKILDDNG